jgi:hypothetical protein
MTTIFIIVNNSRYYDYYSYSSHYYDYDKGKLLRYIEYTSTFSILNIHHS